MQTNEQEFVALTIGDAALASGLPEDTIRYYEKIGLIPPPKRRENRHRMYSQADIERMRIITCLKKTGMSLEEMKPYMNMTAEDDLSAFPELQDLLRVHKKKIEAQMASLQKIADLIDSKLASGARLGGISECELATPSPAPPR